VLSSQRKSKEKRLAKTPIVKVKDDAKLAKFYQGIRRPVFTPRNKTLGKKMEDAPEQQPGKITE
jgi:hypothetical protein